MFYLGTTAYHIGVLLPSDKIQQRGELFSVSLNERSDLLCPATIPPPLSRKRMSIPQGNRTLVLQHRKQPVFQHPERSFGAIR